MKSHKLEEIKRMDEVLDEWSHRHLISFFSEYREITSIRIEFTPVCPLCQKRWTTRIWVIDPYGQTERKIQAWLSSIMSRHYKKEHDFDMIKVHQSLSDINPNCYQCPRCEKRIEGLLHAIAHWLKCSQSER